MHIIREIFLSANLKDHDFCNQSKLTRYKLINTVTIYNKMTIRKWSSSSWSMYMYNDKSRLYLSGLLEESGLIRLKEKKINKKGRYLTCDYLLRKLHRSWPLFDIVMFHTICVLRFNQHQLEQKVKFMIYRHAFRRFWNKGPRS